MLGGTRKNAPAIKPVDSNVHHHQPSPAIRQRVHRIAPESSRANRVRAGPLRSVGKKEASRSDTSRGIPTSERPVEGRGGGRARDTEREGGSLERERRRKRTRGEKGDGGRGG